MHRYLDGGGDLPVLRGVGQLGDVMAVGDGGFVDLQAVDAGALGGLVLDELSALFGAGGEVVAGLDEQLDSFFVGVAGINGKRIAQTFLA